jgi:hypothetical protein
MEKEREGFVVITNAIRPFHVHNISILSLPPGATYHFRYPRPYVGEGLSRNIEGLQGLLLLRNKETAEFLPLRWCTGAAVEDYGEFVFFDFRFDLIFDARSLKEGEAWKGYQARVEKLLPRGVTNLPGTDLAPLVFPVPVSTLKAFGSRDSGVSGEEANDDHVRRWLALISLLGQLEAYRDEHFYTVSRTYHEKESRSELCAYGRLSPSRRGYKFVGNRVYFVEVIQATVPFRKGKGPVEELRLTSPAGHIQELRTSWMIDGPYDRVRFLFYVVPQELQRTPSILILSKLPRAAGETVVSRKGETELAAVEPVGLATRGGSPVPPTLLDLDIIWGVKRFFWKRLLPWATALLGVVLFFGADRMSKQWPFQGMANAAEDLRYAAIFALAWAFNSLSSFVSSLKVTTKGPN